VLTDTSTVAAPWLGTVAVIDVSELTVKVAATLPNITCCAAVKPLPLIVMVPPPAIAPDGLLSPVTTGAEASAQVNTSADEVVDVPKGVVTLMWPLLVPAGATAVIWVGESPVKLVAAVPANVTALAPFRLLPVMTTVVPPAIGPWLVPMLDTEGAVPVYVNWSAETTADVPPGPITVTSTAPAVKVSGAVAVIDVAELTVKLLAGWSPNITSKAPVNPDPVTLVDVPPPVGPLVVPRPEMTGAAIAVY
jgi:hypothetical protein